MGNMLLSFTCCNVCINSCNHLPVHDPFYVWKNWNNNVYEYEWIWYSFHILWCLYTFMRLVHNAFYKITIYRGNMLLFSTCSNVHINSCDHLPVHDPFYVVFLKEVTCWYLRYHTDLAPQHNPTTKMDWK